MKSGLNIYELKEQVAYLQGIGVGMGLDERDDEGHLLVSVIDTLEQIVSTLDGMTHEYEDINHYLSVMDRDLESVEDSFLSKKRKGLASFVENDDEDILQL